MSEGPVSIEGISLPRLPLGIRPAELAAFLRFCDTCDDGEGYDVPRGMMDLVESRGLIVSRGRGCYVTTELGVLVEEVARLAAQGQSNG